MRATVLVLLTVLLAGCGVPVRAARAVPTFMATSAPVVPTDTATAVPSFATVSRSTTTTAVATTCYLGAGCFSMVDTATTVAALPTTYPPASEDQINAMLALVDLVARTCNLTPDQVSQTVLGDEQYLGTLGIVYGSVPEVDAMLRDVYNQVRTTRIACPYAFGGAVQHIEEQHGLLSANGPYLYPVTPTPTP